MSILAFAVLQRELVARRSYVHCRRAIVTASRASKWLGVFLLAGTGSVFAQEPVSPTVEVSEFSKLVTLTVEDADIVNILNAFSQQTGRSMVVGPGVEGNVNLRLRNVPWNEALDVILKPYGYGYQILGETIVVNLLEKIREVETVEPVSAHVFELKYLDAADVEEIVEAQLSPRGHVSILAIRGQKGWEFESSSGGRGNRRSGGGNINKRRRVKVFRDELVRSKTIMVVDIPSSIQRITTVLEAIDRQPTQVLIEAKFVEVNSDLLQDIGVEFGTGATGAEVPGVQPQLFKQGDDLIGLGAQQISGTAAPRNFKSDSNLSPNRPFDAGLSLMFQQLTDTQFQVLMHMLEEDASLNVLSSPRILTLNNQEAAIIVGTKFPIISSETSGQNATVSTSLEYYENIGIQLNVVPQVCDGNFINMIVHPAVTDQIGTTSARTGTDVNDTLTEYPILSTREAETQILLQSGNTVIIGGLLEDRESIIQSKVPLLGNIPFLGRLFRRDTIKNQQFDLLIFLTATIFDPDLHPMKDERAFETRIELSSFLENSEEVFTKTVPPTELPEEMKDDPGETRLFPELEAVERDGHPPPIGEANAWPEPTF
jgi:type IV pilus assembly protein PilQ